MTIEAENNRLVDTRKRFNNSGQELAFALWNLWEIVLDDREADLVISKLQYIWWANTVQTIWNMMKQEWYRLCIDTSKAKSHFDWHDKKIVLWVKDVYDARQTLWFLEDVSDKYVFWEILHHEMCHYLLNSKTQTERRQLILVNIQNILIRCGWHITKLTRHYEYPNTIKDDIVELIRMYTYKPSYLRQYLDWLYRTFDQQTMESFSLTRISKQDADNLFNYIEMLFSKNI